MTKKKAPGTPRKPGTKPNKRGGPSTAKRKANPSSQKGKALTPDLLNPSQVMVLNALIRGATILEAAEAGSCSISGVKYMLTIDAFRDALVRAQADLRERAITDADRLITELLPAATTDIRLFLNEDGSIKSVSDWTEAMGKSVASIEVDELFDGVGEKKVHIGYTRKLKFWNKVDAVDKLAKLLGAYAAEKKELSGVVGVVVVPSKTPAPETISRVVATQ